MGPQPSDYAAKWANVKNLEYFRAPIFQTTQYPISGTFPLIINNNSPSS